MKIVAEIKVRSRDEWNKFWLLVEPLTSNQIRMKNFSF